MAANLLDILKGYITPDVISQAGNVLGESENATSKAISASVPALLSGLINKSGDSQIMGSVMGLVNDSSLHSGDLLSNLSGMLSGTGSGGLDLGSKLIQLIFGSKQTGVSNVIAEASGIKSSSAGSILSMAGTLLLGYLGKTGTTQSDLTGMLTSQKNSILAAAPAGLSSLLGFGSAIKNDVRQSVDEVKSGGNRWLVPLLVVAAALLGIYFLSKNCNKKPETTTVTNAADTLMNNAGKSIDTIGAKVSEAATETANALGNFFKFKLPNGVELNAPEFGIENKLNTWLMDKTKVVDKTTWFNFDRLLFDTGKATLLPGSQEQLKNIAEILKAYPSVEIKIGGYTDNVGNPADNMKLSGERAKSVMNELVAMGINAKRISAEGYGEQYPVASNDTEEGRAQNRRIAVRVTKK